MRDADCRVLFPFFCQMLCCICLSMAITTGGTEILTRVVIVFVKKFCFCPENLIIKLNFNFSVWFNGLAINKRRKSHKSCIIYISVSNPSVFVCINKACKKNDKRRLRRQELQLSNLAILFVKAYFQNFVKMKGLLVE